MKWTIILSIFCINTSPSLHSSAIVAATTTSATGVGDLFINDYHYPMVADEIRNQLYYEVLQQTIISNHSRVLDVGAGTMLLSMMALDCGAKEVLGVEAHPNMINIAKEVLHMNNYQHDVASGRVKLFEGQFEKLSLGHPLISEPMDIFVSETFDAALIGEGFLSILTHAKLSGLLTPNATIIPNSATIYGELLESTLSLPRGRNDSNYMAVNGRYNLEPMRKYRPSNVYTVRYLNEQNAVRQRLSKPYALFEYDFQNFQAPEMNFAYSCLLFKITEANEGLFDSIGLWFKLYLDKEKHFIVTNAPENITINSIHDRYHNNQYDTQHSAPCWMQAIYRVSKDVYVKRGDMIRLQIVQLQHTYVIGDVGMGQGNRNSRLINFIARNCKHPVNIYGYRNDPYEEIDDSVRMDGTFGIDDAAYEYLAGTINPRVSGEAFEIVSAHIYQRFKLVTQLPSGRRLGMWYQVPDSSLKFGGNAATRARKKLPLDTYIVECP